VRTVNLAGEPLPRALVEQLYEHTGVRCVYNLYGPTETTTYSTYTAVEHGATRSPTIGRPIANTQIYILDRHRQPVPVGVPGELYIGGAGVARGYLHRPDLTAHKFIADPFSTNPGARLYRTGDRARYLPDGTIEFLGRLDHQVKIRGFRIEPGEIEAVLGQHPAVREAVVIVREDTPGDKRLGAYVVAHQAALVTSSELRHLVKERLPEFMVPDAFVMLDALPLTASGKVDRRALPAPERGRAAVESTYVAPRSPMEELIAGIWAEVLGLAQISVHDNFFEVGGHSLLATQVMARVRASLQVEVPLRTLFEAPTLAGLAEAVRELQAKGASRPVPAIRPVSLEAFRVKVPPQRGSGRSQWS
jgi:acyl carrier protein